MGRCDLPKHRCLRKREIKPGPIPKHMGWLYTAKDSPEHQVSTFFFMFHYFDSLIYIIVYFQLRCGWRPGHISCQVLKKIEQHNCMKSSDCTPCPSSCSKTPCSKPCCMPPKCLAVCPSSTSCCKTPVCNQPLIRIIRHGGQYSICTKPSNISNAPSGPYPLKYVLNTDDNNNQATGAKYSIEAKFNDYHFDYTASQSSFVLDFSPPEPNCVKSCTKKSVTCTSPTESKIKCNAK